MLATVTNLSASASVYVPAPIDRTIAASGNVVLGLSLADLQAREETGNPNWKVINDMVKRGLISVAFADDANTSDVLDRARNT